jgi:hypothetical protein
MQNEKNSINLKQEKRKHFKGIFTILDKITEETNVFLAVF